MVKRGKKQGGGEPIVGRGGQETGVYNSSCTVTCLCFSTHASWHDCQQHVYVQDTIMCAFSELHGVMVKVDDVEHPHHRHCEKCPLETKNAIAHAQSTLEGL